MSRLLLIRHAQASFLAKDYDQLSELGFRQSRKLGEYLVAMELEPDQIYIGPLRRHWQTFEQVREVYKAQGVELPQPRILTEWDEHRGPEVMRALLPQLIARYEAIRRWDREAKADPKLTRRNYLRIFHYFMHIWAGGSLDLPHPEHLEDWPSFRLRVSRGIEKILADNGSGVTVACFTSGGAVSAAIGHALEMTSEERIVELNGKVVNTSITKFLFSKGRISLQSFNEVMHLVERHMITLV